VVRSFHQLIGDEGRLSDVLGFDCSAAVTRRLDNYNDVCTRPCDVDIIRQWGTHVSSVYDHWFLDLITLVKRIL